MKFKHYGIEGPALNLLVDFMKNRNQRVIGKAGSLQSDGQTPHNGVPQGSSLSNLAFTLLLNDLPHCISDAEVFMYADDVAMIITAPTIDELEKHLNLKAEQALKWFQTNGLALNILKTQFVRFNLAGRKCRRMSITLNNERIEQAEKTLFLGFQMDQGLKWDAHIDELCGKLSTACFALKRVVSTLSAETARACYFASVHSLLQYGIELWGRGADWERAFKLQKRAVRLLAKVAQDTSARPYYTSLGILTLPNLLIFSTALYVVNHKDEFKTRSDTKCLRYPHRLLTKGGRLKKASKTVKGMGAEVYNRIPLAIRNISSLSIFKSKLKAWLIEKSFYSYNEFLDCKVI